jgi:hypothetical protein
VEVVATAVVFPHPVVLSYPPTCVIVNQVVVAAS